MINKSLYSVIAGIIVASILSVMISLPTVIAQQQEQQTASIVNPNTNNSNNNGYLFNCKDGIVTFENNNSLKMGCVVAPFVFKPFNGTDAKTYQNTPSPIHIDMQKICTNLHIDKKICNKFPKSIP